MTHSSCFYNFSKLKFHIQHFFFPLLSPLKLRSDRCATEAIGNYKENLIDSIHGLVDYLLIFLFKVVTSYYS